MKINFKVITPQGTIYEKEISSLNIQTSSGYITVLPEHFPIITTIVPCVVNMKINSDVVVASAASGILKVNENETKLIVSAFELKDQIDINRAKDALKRAQERLASNSLDIDKNRAEFSLMRAMARIKAASDK